MANDEHLDQARLERLLQFQDLTGMEDMDQCRRILEMHNWDLEVAVQDTLVMHDGEQMSPPPLPNQVSQFQPLQLTNFLFQPARQQRGFFGWAVFLVFFPFRVMYASFYNIVSFVLGILQPASRRFVTDSVVEVVSFIAQYEKRHGNHHPVFYQGSYSQAISDAKKELKFLLVYLHGDSHQDTDEFCQTTLRDEELIVFINTNMLFWACTVNSAEGYRASQALQENTYPFLAVVVLKQNRMVVVSRIEGFITARDLRVRLQKVVEDNERYLATARAEIQERTINRDIRSQQDEAYMESLRADQEKERIRRQEREQMEQELKEQRNRENEEHQRNEEFRRMKVELRDQIPSEPTPDTPNTIRVVIKLPRGQRLERRFLRTQSLKYLYYFVFCCEDSPNEFEIVTNFPRRVLPCQPSSDNPEPHSFAEFGLGRSETLFVHDLEA